jgi:hypothetical protein
VSGDSYEWHHGPDAEQRGVTAREAGFGSFEATRLLPYPGQHDGPWLLRVKRADPRILISGLMMDMIRDGHGCGWKIDGDLLRFKAVNGTWVYRVGEYLEERRAWVAEWPD